MWTVVHLKNRIGLRTHLHRGLLSRRLSEGGAQWSKATTRKERIFSMEGLSHVNYCCTKKTQSQNGVRITECPRGC